MYSNEYVKSVAYYKAQHALATSLGLAHMQSYAALNMGLAVTLHVRAARQGSATGAAHAPGPHSHSWASASLPEGEGGAGGEQEEEACRGMSKFQGCQSARGGRVAPGCLRRWACTAQVLQAHLVFNASQEDEALAHLREHLTWRVERGRHTCTGGGQTRGEVTPMLSCRVARFCSADHQKMSLKKALPGDQRESDHRVAGRHKNICGVWRHLPLLVKL